MKLNETAIHCQSPTELGVDIMYTAPPNSPQLQCSEVDLWGQNISLNHFYFTHKTERQVQQCAELWAVMHGGNKVK